MRFKLFTSVAPLWAPDGVGSSGSSQGTSSPASTPSSGASSSSSGGSTTVAPGVSPPPSSAPASGAPSATPAPGSGEAFDFGSIFEAPAAQPRTTPVATPPAAAPAAVPPQVPTGAEPAAQPPGAQPPAQPPGPGDSGQQQQPASPPASGQPAVDPYDPVALMQYLGANEAVAIQHVASTMFQLSPEDVQGLESDIVGSIPRLMAKAFVRSQMNVLLQLGRIVPEMVRRSSDAIKQHLDNEGAFYTKWPQLNKATHGELVNRYGATYRMMYPAASKEQMMEDLGHMVMMAAKIPFAPAAPGAAPAAQNPMAQANGTRPPQPQPFVPATPGPAASSQQQALDAWEAVLTHQGQ